MRHRPNPNAVEHIDYSFVPNHRVTMEALVRTPLTGRQLRLILLILNQTDGYLRQQDHLGPTFLAGKTGIREEHCYHTLAQLKAMGIVSSPSPGIFQVNPPSLWRTPQTHPLARVPPTAAGGSTLLPPAAVAHAADGSELNPHKENPLKKTPKENPRPRSRESRGQGAETAPKERNREGKPGKPRHADAVEALVAIEREAGVKLVDRPKLIHALRRTLVAYPEATPESLADCQRRLTMDEFWGRKPPATLVMRIPDEFPLYWRLKAEGRVQQFHEKPQGRRGYAETRVSAAYTDPEDYPG